LSVGGNIIVGGESIADEQVTVATANTIAVQGTPIAWGDLGTIGWYTLPGESNWTKITFNGKSATVSGLKVGDKVCVRYNATNDALREFVVPAAIIPAECKAVLTTPLFQAEAKNFTTSSKVGDLIVEIPRFLLSGAQDLTLNMSGASTTNLSGSALAAFTGNEGCNDYGYYAKIKEIIYGKQFYEGLFDLAIANGTVKNGDVVNVYGLYQNGSTSHIRPSLLTFTGATVDPTTGIASAIASAGTLIAKVKAPNGVTLPPAIASIEGVAKTATA
ncbi:MAG: hypothetical protein ACRDDY_07890, partial [Clostridium sp.]|uniref:hypothetical protein n=1 Tax=Clostridium sp. TaxID=1506 RepID=UPI003EE44392